MNIWGVATLLVTASNTLQKKKNKVEDTCILYFKQHIKNFPSLKF